MSDHLQLRNSTDQARSGHARRDPGWWNRGHEAAWLQEREAFRHGWEQTRPDVGEDSPELKQVADPTLDEVTRGAPAPPDVHPDFETYEPAIRFGYGARRQYELDVCDWNDDIQERLEQEWQDLYLDEIEDGEQYMHAIRHGWEYRPSSG